MLGISQESSKREDKEPVLRKNLKQLWNQLQIKGENTETRTEFRFELVCDEPRQFSEKLSIFMRKMPGILTLRHNQTFPFFIDPKLLFSRLFNRKKATII